EDCPDWCCNVCWRQHSRCHLVQQGLEEMEVAAVHNRQVYVGMAQGLCGVQPAESGSHYHDSMPWLLHHGLVYRDFFHVILCSGKFTEKPACWGRGSTG